MYATLSLSLSHDILTRSLVEKKKKELSASRLSLSLSLNNKINIWLLCELVKYYGL